MFSSKIQLHKRTPQDGTDRENFLSFLVDEYLHTNSYDAKCQVLANLANFAYDPINYTFIRNVGVLDITLHVLKNETDSKLLHFATACICNLCIDPANAEYILTYLGLKPIIALLKHKDNEIVADVITILLYLYNEKTKPEITSSDVISMIEGYTKSDNNNIKNLATIFLQDINSQK